MEEFAQEFKIEELQEDLLLGLHKMFPNTIDDNAKMYVAELRYEKGKAHGCIYSGKTTIQNKEKGIRLDFELWFDVYCFSYSPPDIKPDIRTYLTGEYAKLAKLRGPVPEMGLKAVILLNIPEPPSLSPAPKDQRYFDAYWYVFETPKGNYVLSKEGWFGTYVYDKKLGMRPARNDEWVDIPDKVGWKKLKDGLEMVQSKEAFKEPVKEFMIKRYEQKIVPDLYVEL